MQAAVLFSHTVTTEQSGKMLKQLLHERWGFSQSMIRKCKHQGLVHVNGELMYYTARVVAGDQIEVYYQASGVAIAPELVDLHIVYEDQDLLVLEKPPGQVVHPTKGHPTGTMANGIAHYFAQQAHPGSIHFVNRLDKDTSGLMVVAKHPHAHAFLAREIAQKRYQRTYLALVHGVITADQGTIDASIRLADESMIKRIVSDDPTSKHAVTHYTVMERFAEATMLRLQLETGRTHQIRVHLAHLGHPLIGDTLYGAPPDDQMPRQALHAAELSLLHPRERTWKKWQSFFPPDIMKRVHVLRMMK